MSLSSRKVRALVAGGAVLGVGAAVTLAAWSDSEFAQGSFTTGSFGIEASANGTDYASHTTAENALALSFNASELAPGEVASADYSVRNIAGGADSVVTFASESVSAPFDAKVFLGETELTEGQTFELTGDAAQALRVEVSLPADYANTTSSEATIVWGFNAAQK